MAACDDDPYTSPRSTSGHAADQVTDLARHSRPARLSRSGQSRPVCSEPPSPPGDDRFGPNDDQSFPPSWPDTGQPGPEDPVARTDAGPTASSTKYAQLMAESKILDLEGCSGSEGPAEGAEESGKPNHGVGILMLLGCLAEARDERVAGRGFGRQVGSQAGQSGCPAPPDKSKRHRPMQFSGRTICGWIRVRDKRIARTLVRNSPEKSGWFRYTGRVDGG
jgi:hypothetical protein